MPILEHYNQPTLNINILVSNLSKYRTTPLQMGAKINKCIVPVYHIQAHVQGTDSMVHFKLILICKNWQPKLVREAYYTHLGANICRTIIYKSCVD